MARSRESLWLWAGASFVAVGTALGGAAGGLAAARPGYRLWSSAPMVGAYIAGTLALVCLLAAVRDWQFPFAADRSGRVPDALKWVVPPTPGWVDRAELAEVVSAITGAGGGAVTLTTGLVGAGGFGKTMLAARACQDGAVQQRFPGGLCWITVGRELDGEGLAQRISEAVRNLGGEGPAFTSLEEAGHALARALAARQPMLLVADDVWTRGQLVPFVTAGQAGRLLVTTRRPDVLAGAEARQVKVDAVPGEVAWRILARGLPPMAGRVEEDLLELAGGWPLLLSLINARLAEELGRGAGIDAAARDAADRLQRDGPAALDVTDVQSRELAVAATIGYSLDTLDAADRDRFCQLGIFAEDAEVPLPLIAALWQATATAGSSQADAAALCERLDGLSLVSLAWADDQKVLVVHDVIRDFVRSALGPQRVAELNGVLLAAVAANLPPASPPDAAALPPMRVAWWELGRRDRYLWDHLIEHLLDAEQLKVADAVGGDLRWVGARLELFGPAAPVADLSLVATPRAARLRTVLTRTAHLLAPTAPAEAVVDVLHSRVADDPEWGTQVTALRHIYRRPRLVNRWALPDLPDPALRRVLEGHTDTVLAMAVAPDGSWLASGGSDGPVRIWDVATGQTRATLGGHTQSVLAMAVAPDGSWLTASYGWTVRIWNLATGQEQATLTGDSGYSKHWKLRILELATGQELATPRGSENMMGVVAVAPDGSWLATGSMDRGVRIWDVATGQERATLTDHNGPLMVVAVAPDSSYLTTVSHDGTIQNWDATTGQARTSLGGRIEDMTSFVAVAPDGSWLASGRYDGMVRIWDLATGQTRATLEGPTGYMETVAVAPDGSWLATHGDRSVRIWDVATGLKRATLKGHTGHVRTAVVAPDGSWLATSYDGPVRIWDVATGQKRATLKGHTGPVNTMAVAPDGSWLATGGTDRRVRIWDVATRQSRARQGHTESVTAVAVAPDGSWLATGGGDDGTVRIWDVASGQTRATLEGHVGHVTAVAVAPDGSWLATGGSSDATVRIWDIATGQKRATLEGHTQYVEAVAVAPDGSWLASGCYDGTVRIWDLATQQAHPLEGHAGPVRAVAVAPDGSWLATGGSDATVRIWDVATGQKRATLEGHTGVEAVAVGPDGSWLATGSYDGTVRIWDVATSQKRATLEGHTGVEAVAVAPDGSWLATGSYDGTVRIWDVATGQAQALMRLDNRIHTCAWLGINRLAIGGPAGLYMFDFLTVIPSANARR